MITLDEAIAHAREVAKSNKTKATYDDKFLKRFCTSKKACIKCAEENEQLAEWLEELKDYQQHEIICNKGYNAGYNKAIDDCIKEVDEEKKQHNHTITKDCLFWLKRKFEQLKAGGENDD